MTAGVAQAGRGRAGVTARSQPAVAEARELLVVLGHALLDRVAVGAGVDDAPHRVGDLLGASRASRGRASRPRARARAARSSPPRCPSPSERGNGTPGRWSSQAPFDHGEAVAERDRIGHRAARVLQMRAVPIVVARAHVPAAARLPQALHARRGGLARARGARDGGHRRDPVADRPGDRRDRRRRPRRAARRSCS